MGAGFDGHAIDLRAEAHRGSGSRTSPRRSLSGARSADSCSHTLLASQKMANIARFNPFGELALTLSKKEPASAREVAVK